MHHHCCCWSAAGPSMIEFFQNVSMPMISAQSWRMTSYVVIHPKDAWASRIIEWLFGWKRTRWNRLFRLCDAATWLMLCCLLGWLLKKPSTQVDTIFTVFKSVWSDLYRYVSQELQPKMEVWRVTSFFQALMTFSATTHSANNSHTHSLFHVKKWSFALQDFFLS